MVDHRGQAGEADVKSGRWGLHAPKSVLSRGQGTAWAPNMNVSSLCLTLKLLVLLEFLAEIPVSAEISKSHLVVFPRE